MLPPACLARLAGIVALVAGAAAPAAGTEVTAIGSSLDELIQRFGATPQPAPRGEVRLDAWIESEGEEHTVVVSIAPEGETRLIADPGITVAPVGEQPGITWLVPLPHRHVDPAREYFDPPAAVRMPFSGEDDLPIELEVEYAYCVIDFQCFFGEETVTAQVRSD
jgi:hypothetical protein